MELSAHAASSRVLQLLKPTAEVGDLLRRRRRELGWTQQQLADFFGVRTQTVSAWERRNNPQRRFFAKIAEFLDLPGMEAVESLLPGRQGDVGVVAAANDGPPPEAAKLQALVVEAVASQVSAGRNLSPGLVNLLQDLMRSVGLPASAVLLTAMRDGSDRPDL